MSSDRARLPDIIPDPHLPSPAPPSRRTLFEHPVDLHARVLHPVLRRRTANEQAHGARGRCDCRSCCCFCCFCCGWSHQPCENTPALPSFNGAGPKKTRACPECCGDVPVKARRCKWCCVSLEPLLPPPPPAAAGSQKRLGSTGGSLLQSAGWGCRCWMRCKALSSVHRPAACPLPPALLSSDDEEMHRAKTAPACITADAHTPAQQPCDQV